MRLRFRSQCNHPTGERSGLPFQANRRTLRSGTAWRVSLRAPGRFDARLINIYRRAEAAPEDEKVKDPKSPPSSRSMNTKAENLFKNAVKNLKRGRQEKALELFEQAKAADPSEEMAQRIEAALRESP